ncbi:MAG: PD40 domain-containing protein [Sphingobacteriaceae bacterium]|nr:PD40 domain-containing protein [Sphingobacteriaceae bacterium]
MRIWLSILCLVLVHHFHAQVNFTSQKSGKNSKPDELNLFKFANVRDFAMNKWGTEVYFSVQSAGSEISAIVWSKKKKGKWSAPEVISFSGKFNDLEPFLSLDNTRLYFVSNRPLSKTGTQTKDFDIWYCERNPAGNWGEPRNLGAPVNSSENEFYPSLAKTVIYILRMMGNALKERTIFLFALLKTENTARLFRFPIL